MLKRICLNCKKTISGQFVCQDCEIGLILSCQMRKRFVRVNDSLIELIYFWDYKSVARKIIMNGKYRFNKRCFRFLADIVTAHYAHRIDFLTGILSYVPTTYLRFCYRGFNQAKLFAEIFLKGCLDQNLKLQKILKRNSYTQAQAKKGQIARLNKKNQFSVKGIIPNQSKIVIFDDVCTTGSTLESIQREILKSNPSCKILFVTIAYTKRFAQDLTSSTSSK